MTQAKIMDMHNLPDGISIVDLVLLKRRVEWMSDNSAPISRAEILRLIELAKYYAALKRFIEQDSTWQDAKKVQPVHDGIVLVMLEKNKDVRQAWYYPSREKWWVFESDKGEFHSENVENPVIYWAEFPLWDKSNYLFYETRYDGGNSSDADKGENSGKNGFT